MYSVCRVAAFQNGHADAAEFIRWRWKHGLSLTAAAEALGLSRRTVAYYVSGEQQVPRTVLLALKGEGLVDAPLVDSAGQAGRISLANGKARGGRRARRRATRAA